MLTGINWFSPDFGDEEVASQRNDCSQQGGQRANRVGTARQVSRSKVLYTLARKCLKRQEKNF